jgi:hypothetical protein
MGLFSDETLFPTPTPKTLPDSPSGLAHKFPGNRSSPRSVLALSGWGDPFRNGHLAASPKSCPTPKCSRYWDPQPSNSNGDPPGREILCSRLQHPRLIALLGQHPRGSNSHLVYYLCLGKLAVEVRFPDALHGEVCQIVYAFSGHEPSSAEHPTPRELLCAIPDSVRSLADSHKRTYASASRHRAPR